jgi:phosphopantothenoylcysteine decarboxylase/phosphopantothenate--cysteine ligase
VIADRKIKKEPGQTALTLELERTPDILADVAARAEQFPGLVRVGFAAESNDLLENAAVKLRSKGLALIAANDITASDAGFATETNRVALIDHEGIEHLPLVSKYDVANRLLDRIAALLRARGHTDKQPREVTRTRGG